MTLNVRINRVLRGMRTWRGQSSDGPIPVSPELSDTDWRHLATEIDATVETKGGPVAARRRARTIGLTYQSLNDGGRLRFLTNLARDYGHDDRLVDEAMDAVFRAEDADKRRRAEVELRNRLRPRRELLLRRLAGLEGGLPFLIELRSDLLAHRRSSTELAALDRDLRQILEEWFDVGLLELERLTWDTGASFLEKLIEYEAVHAIESWDDLKNRLGPGRRCYAFVHPGMPDDPLIFVEVALTKKIARELAPLLNADPDEVEPRTTVDENDFDTAIFYSISNCHDGLAGVSLGDFLIKSVVEELAGELAGLKTFATLSPVPGFRGWLQTQLAGDRQLTAPDDPDDLRRLLHEVVNGEARDPEDPELLRLRPTLLRIVANYLLEERRSDRAADPVAHFHLSNGARVEHINWMGNPSPVGWDRGLGFMVNYRYELRAIERNHDQYTNEAVVAASDAVRKLTDSPKA